MRTLQEIRNYLADVNTLSIIARLVLAVIFSGILGIERGRKKRPAGFRTYMLVCIGATLAMITSQYTYEIYNIGDPTRIGAQVISGIGFLGAGTIIVTGSNQVKGLTTAAGLWACASMGLAIGIGFYEGAIIGCFFIFFAMNTMHKLDSYVTARSQVIDVYIEFKCNSNISFFLNYVREHNMDVAQFQINQRNTPGIESISTVLTIKCKEKRAHEEIINILGKSEGVQYLQEI